MVTSFVLSTFFSLYFLKSTLLDFATETDRKELFKELKLMADVGEHPNVVNLVGACAMGGNSKILKNF